MMMLNLSLYYSDIDVGAVLESDVLTDVDSIVKISIRKAKELVK